MGKGGARRSRTMMVRERASRFYVSLIALATVAVLGGCSSVPNAVNPVAWYRSLSGASKNDALDRNQPNQQNLEAGGKAPYPNLADVPDAPDQALSAAKRDAMRKSLAADRENARYSDEQLRAGVSAPGMIAPPPPAPPGAVPAAAAPAPPPAPAAAAAAPSRAAASAAPQQQDAAAPKESTLVQPTIPNVPEGEAPAPPPPPPNLSPSPAVHAAGESPRAALAALGSGKRRAAAASSVQVASINFAGGSAALSDEERNRLSEVAAMQHDKGGAIRIVGHAEPAKGGTVAQQELASLSLALNRAKAVAQVLSGEGVAAQSIDVEAAPTLAGDASAARAEVYLEH
jgi:outer membrane protein OmpA-like peptidoglycan-associated protein